jgi:hypothetical protein
MLINVKYLPYNKPPSKDIGINGYKIMARN